MGYRTRPLHNPNLIRLLYTRLPVLLGAGLSPLLSQPGPPSSQLPVLPSQHPGPGSNVTALDPVL